MSDTITAPSAAAAVSRRLTVAEVNTVRAALRVWTRLEVGGGRGRDDALIVTGHRELDVAEPVVSDGEAEQLLGELAGEGVVVTVTRVDLHDARRI